jgi:hypothetical protein
MNLSVELWNQDETERYPNIDDEIEDLNFSSIAGLGFATCTFTVKRSPRYYYDDLKPTNVVIVRNPAKVVWQGEIINPGVEIGDTATMPVQCDGSGYRLATRLTTATFGAEKLSTWITDHLLPNEDLGFSSADGDYFDTDDYTFPYGIDIGASTTGNYFAEVLEKGNKANGYFYGVWEDKTFYYHPYPSEADYIIDVDEEGTETSLAYSLEDIVNYLRVSYSPDGSSYSYFWWPTDGPDEDSEELYRRRDGTLAVQGQASLTQAQTMGTVYLNEHKRMRPKSSFVCKTVRDTNGREVDPSEVRAGKVAHIENLYSIESTISDARGINELSTFEIAQASYADGRVTVSPGEMGLMMEKILARIEARAKPQ